MWLILALLIAGSLAGFAAGLFGIGGGAIMVPALYYTFNVLGYPSDIIMHLSVATSAAVIIVTAPRSAYGHHQKQSVDWNMVWPRPVLKNLFENWGLWIGVGALIGSGIIANFISGDQLTLIFGILMVLIAGQFIFGRPDQVLAKDIPNSPAAPIIGSSLGSICALLGIGFGSIGVSFMLLFGKTAHRAIGTAAAIGFFIGFPAAIGYVISGWGVPGRPPASLGYVNLIGFSGLALMTFLCVPLGVKAAHNLDQKKLKIIFGVCLLLVSLNMIRKAVF